MPPDGEGRHGLKSIALRLPRPSNSPWKCAARSCTTPLALPMPELFDQFAHDYTEKVQEAITLPGVKHEFFTEVKVKHILRAAEWLGPVSSLSFLDVGCGVGETDRLLAPQVGFLHGIDVSQDSIDRARVAIPQGHYQVDGGDRIPFDDASIDFAFAVCVMHHVPPSQWASLVAEMKRVVRPAGFVAIYEHNPYNPLTRWVVNRCEFDRDAVLLSRGKTKSLLRSAGMAIVEARDILYFPFRSPIFRRIESALGWLPLGAQYAVVARAPH
jgi:SAM-dependent methyltransferase